MTDNELFLKLPEEAVKRELITYKVRIGLKSSRWIHRAINTVLNWFYPKDRQNWYLNGAITTLGFRIDFPDDMAGTDIGKDRPVGEEGFFIGADVRTLTAWWILLHEFFHVRSAMRKTRLWFDWLYGWPLTQGGLLLLTCWLPVFWAHGWWRLPWILGWAVVAGLHFIPQLPDPFRKNEELAAYTASMWAHRARGGKLDEAFIEYVVESFHSMAYFIMAPNKDKIRRELTEIATSITAGTHPIKDDPLVKLVEELRAS